MKKCPYCESELSDTARKCKFCGEWTKTDKASNNGNKIKEKKEGYWKTFGIKLLMYIPNFILVVLLCTILFFIILTLGYTLTFWYGEFTGTYAFSEFISYQESNILISFLRGGSIIISFIFTTIYLFAKTKRKYFFMLDEAPFVFSLFFYFCLYILEYLAYKNQY